MMRPHNWHKFSFESWLAETAKRMQHPALLNLAGNIGLAGLALRIQQVEVLIQPLFADLRV